MALKNILDKTGEVTKHALDTWEINECTKFLSRYTESLSNLASIMALQSNSVLSSEDEKRRFICSTRRE